MIELQETSKNVRNRAKQLVRYVVIVVVVVVVVDVIVVVCCRCCCCYGDDVINDLIKCILPVYQQILFRKKTK